MPISNGFGRGLNDYSPQHRIRSTSTDMSSAKSSRSMSRTHSILKLDSSKPVFELHDTTHSSSNDDELVIVKPVSSAIIVEKPLPRQSKCLKRVIFESHEPRHYYRGRCCRNMNDVDEFQFFDCTNGRCCKLCACLETMYACPVWFWLFFTLLLLLIVGTLIAFMNESPLLNSSKLVYKYIYGTNNYERRSNVTIFLYAEGPCYKTLPAIAPTNDTNTTTTALTPLLCNQTTTRTVLTQKDVYEYRNQVVYSSANLSTYYLFNFLICIFSLVISLT